MPSIRLPESIGALTKTSSTTVNLAASRVNVGGLQFVFANPISLSSAVAGVGGFDATIQAWKKYNIFVVRDSVGLPGLIASLNESLPTGFSAARWVGYLDTGASAQINGASTTQEGTVGQIRTALLTESQFQLENGMGWILADGRNVEGSRFATLFGANTVPDLRGVALRGKNNGRADGKENPGVVLTGRRTLGSPVVDQLNVQYMKDIRIGSAVVGVGIPTGATVLSKDEGAGSVTLSVSAASSATGVTITFSSEYPLGEFQADRFENHEHRLIAGRWKGNGPVNEGSELTSAYNQIPTNTTEKVGGTETRMKNVTVNFFVKVN